MKTSYFNTTHSTRGQLSQYEGKAGSQELQILAYFIAAPSMSHSPSELLRWVFSSQTPITSVRRAVTNLTNAGELVKTGKQVNGLYNRPEYKWRLAPKYAQQDLFG